MKKGENKELEITENLNKMRIPYKNNQAEKGISTDPFGSWTGVPVYDIYDEPVQDVDDL